MVEEADKFAKVDKEKRDVPLTPETRLTPWSTRPRSS
jgi:hypothetical protein